MSSKSGNSKASEHSRNLSALILYWGKSRKGETTYSTALALLALTKEGTEEGQPAINGTQ